MRISIFSVNVAVLFLALFLSFAVSSTAEIININDFIQLVPTMIDSVPAFSYDLGSDIYSNVYSSKDVAFTKSKEVTQDLPKGKSKYTEPGGIEIFDRAGHLVSIPEYTDSRSVYFVPGRDFYTANYKISNEASRLGLFNMEGKLIENLPHSSQAPLQNLKFYYGQSPNPFLPNLYDSPGGKVFTGCSSDNCLIKPLSDSEAFVFNPPTNDLSLVNFEQKKILWQVSSQSPIIRSKTLAGLNANLAFSKMGDIVIVKTQYQCDAFDLHGRYLWSIKYPGDVNFLYEGAAAVCPDNGTLALAEVPFDLKAIDLRIFNSKGMFVSAAILKMDPGEIISSSHLITVDAFHQIILIRFGANYNGHYHPVTGIAYENSGSWSARIVEGTWFLLSDDEGNKALVGFDLKTKKVLGYKANF